MPKVFVEPDNGNIMWRCPGCGTTHAADDRWKFNGDLEKPTLSPSYLATQDWMNPPRKCHCFIRDGQIQFCNDCTHKLNGQTVDMIEFIPGEDWKNKED